MSTRFIDTSPITPTAGFPYRGVTLDHFFYGDNETTNAFCVNMIGSTYIFSNDYIISGCINSTPAGPAFTISAGYIFHLGALSIVDATTFTPAMGQTAVCVIDPTYNTLADPTIFTDGSSHNVHVIRKIKIQAGISGSGFSDFVDLLHVGLITKHKVGDVGEPAYQNSWVGTGGNNLRFRRDISKNMIYFSGGIYKGAYNGAIEEIFTLPLDYRPAEDVLYIINGNVNATSEIIFNVNINASTGKVIINKDGLAFPTAVCFMSFDGLSFFMD